MEAASDKPSVHTAHTQTGHLEALANLCRLCGKRAQSVKEKKKNVSHDASKLRVLIFEVFGVDVSGDQAELHPTLCCTQCYRMVLNVKRRGQSSAQAKYIDDVSTINVNAWCKYDEHVKSSECSVCSRHSLQASGGRPTNPKAGVGTNYRRVDDKFDHIVKDCPALNTRGCQLPGMPEYLKKHFLCPHCHCIMSPRSVSTPCGHEFCSKCLSDVYPQCQRNTEIACPVCHLPVKFETVTSVKTKQPKLYEQLLDLIRGSMHLLWKARESEWFEVYA